MTGFIPDNIGHMKQLESLDLSRNSLSGRIPDGFKNLSFLSFLNLSNNNLSGRIPDCTQLRGLDPSMFMGNNLCGPPLTSNCSDDGHHDQSIWYREDREDDKWLLMLVSLGYAVGFSAICVPLVFKSWRETYYELLQDVWDSIYVYFCIKWRRQQDG